MTLSYEGVEAVLSEESVILNLMTLIQNETGPQTIQAVTAVLHNLAVERSSCLHRLFEDDGTCRAICELRVPASGSNQSVVSCGFDETMLGRVNRRPPFWNAHRALVAPSSGGSRLLVMLRMRWRLAKRALIRCPRLLSRYFPTSELTVWCKQ